MWSEDPEIIGETQIENVSTYTDLGQVISLNKDDKEKEIERRRLAWAVFRKLSHVLKNKKIPQRLRNKISDQFILLVHQSTQDCYVGGNLHNANSVYSAIA